MNVLQLPPYVAPVTREERAALAGKQLAAVKTYRPATGFLLDEPQPRLPNAPDRGYPRRPGKR